MKVIAVTVYEDEPYTSKLLNVGAQGYVTKRADVSEMVQAIRKVIAGQRYISAEIAQQMANHESARTTGLYDRRTDQINLDEVERIMI